MAVSTKSLLVAIDDGYAQTKLVGVNPNGDGLITSIIRSSIRPGRYGLSTLSGSKAAGSYKTEEGEDFTVSDDIESESTQFDGFHTSPLNRVLVNHVLTRAGYAGKKVSLVAGLPVADFFFEGALDNEKIDMKKNNLLKGVVASSGEVANINDVKIGCQAIAAFVDYLLDDELKERDVPTAKVAVVDIGGRTTDIALIVNGNSFDEARSGTSNIGVLDVYEMVAKSIRGNFKTRDKYPLAVMDEAVRTKTITLWGEKHDISEVVINAVREQETKIAREVERRIGAASSVDRVLFVGGGSALFTEVSGHFRNGKTAENPEFANARGLWKYVKHFGG